MNTETWLYVAIVLFATLTLSTLPDRFLRPKAATPQGPYLLMHAITVLLLFIIVSLIVQRVLFAGITVNVLLAILVIVSNAKYKALREPMVFSDISMFSQAFKHPRLYFPFLGWPVLLFGPVIIVALIYALFTLEPALPFNWQRISVSIGLVILLYFSLRTLALKTPLKLSPEDDNANFGLLNSLLAYAFQSATREHQHEIAQTLKKSPFNRPAIKENRIARPELPDITVVQSESFFDARRLHPQISQSILSHFDSCRGNSLAQGQLKVPAWGANTMRSEFSFLSGIAFEAMGFYRYYPYQFLYQHSLFTLATRLKSLGYRCICVHPHHATFFGRERIFPRMGFDQFIESADFSGAPRFGPYVSDQAVSSKLIELSREQSDQPLFIFAITMENHGPLHLERVLPDEHADYFTVPQDKMPLDSKELSDLTVYLRHLKNADKMIAHLTGFYEEQFTQENKETLLCFYGDHVPSMPSVYRKLSYRDDHSDYLIWSSAKQKQAARQSSVISKTIGIESLAEIVEKLALD